MIHTLKESQLRKLSVIENGAKKRVNAMREWNPDDYMLVGYRRRWMEYAEKIRILKGKHIHYITEDGLDCSQGYTFDDVIA
jgi:hypothetical protein